MVIRLDKNYNAMTSTALLGYVGETNARPVSVEGMEIDGADRYVLSIDYGVLSTRSILQAAHGRQRQISCAQRRQYRARYVQKNCQDRNISW